MTRTTTTAAALALAAVLGAEAGDARAQHAFPTQPITFVVPWGAGGRTDAVGRLLAEVMAKELDADVAVVNRAGAAGAIGSKSALDAPADGHTVLVTTPGNHILAPAQRDVGYEPDDFAAVGRAAGGAVRARRGRGCGLRGFRWAHRRGRRGDSDFRELREHPAVPCDASPGRRRGD